MLHLRFDRRITIEQYRARIGAHNCVRIRKCSSHLKGQFVAKASHCDTVIVVEASHCATTIIAKAGHCATAIIVEASHCATVIIVEASHCANAIIVNPSHCATAITVEASKCATAIIVKESHCATAITVEASHCANAIVVKANHGATVIFVKASHCATAIIASANHCATAIVTKRFSQMVVLSLTEVSCYIVFVALLLRMSNDVEENPGPTIYDVVDPAKTICVDFSQGNAKRFGQNAGKQCAAMSLTAIVYGHIASVNLWDSALLNDIMFAGNNLYSFITNSINKNFLLLTDVHVPELVSVFDNIYYLQYSDPLGGDLFMQTTNLPYYSLENAFNNLFGESN